MIKKARQIDDPFSWMRNEKLSLHNFNADVMYIADPLMGC